MFSILIPSWNNLPYLQRCVDSIRRHSVHRHQIVVHVNDGSDGTRDWIRGEARSGTLDASYSDANVGICLAMNEAAQLAVCNYIVYLNDDMFCLPGWDSALLDRIHALPDEPFLLSGTMIEPRDTGNACVVVADFGDAVERFDETGLLAAASGLARPDWLGATWPPTVVHRRWWFNVGGYSTEFSPGMGSDNDFAMKLWQTGCRRFIGVGNSLTYHFQCKSTGRLVRNDGRRQFLHKWGITQTTFDRHYLRRGVSLAESADTLLEDPPQSAAWRFDRLRGQLKRRLS